MAASGPRPRVVVVDHGSGNLRSAERALDRAGADVTVTADMELARAADGVVLPGVGAFAACMAGVRRVGADELVRERLGEGKPVLGICVGMQVLYEHGEEHGVSTEGIGVLPGNVVRMAATILPHMGWNTVVPPGGSRLFDGIDEERFYFVHSYAARPGAGRCDGETLATHDEPFVAAVEQDALAATQFHPEKSGAAGLQLLTNWVGTL